MCPAAKPPPLPEWIGSRRYFAEDRPQNLQKCTQSPWWPSANRWEVGGVQKQQLRRRITVCPAANPPALRETDRKSSILRGGSATEAAKGLDVVAKAVSKRMAAVAEAGRRSGARRSRQKSSGGGAADMQGGGGGNSRRETPPRAKQRRRIVGRGVAVRSTPSPEQTDQY